MRQAPADDEFVRQLPAESRRYAQVTKLLTMVATAARGKDGKGEALFLLLPERIGAIALAALDAAVDDLDKVRAGLRDLANAKRHAFARLYFIADCDLLELLLCDSSSSAAVADAKWTSVQTLFSFSLSLSHSLSLTLSLSPCYIRRGRDGSSRVVSQASPTSATTTTRTVRATESTGRGASR